MLGVKRREFIALIGGATVWPLAAPFLAAGISGTGPASAQTYPSRPITLVVPYPPGGASGHTVAPPMSAMNSRRFTPSIALPPTRALHQRIAQHRCAEDFCAAGFRVLSPQAMSESGRKGKGARLMARAALASRSCARFRPRS